MTNSYDAETNSAVDAAETSFAVVKEHIKQQGSVDMLSLKSYLIGPPGVGKTTTLRRLTGEITHSNSSTGIDAPLTFQLYHDTEQSSVLITEGWKSQGLSEQCQALCSYILNPQSSGNDTQQNATSLEDSSFSGKQSTSIKSSSLEKPSPSVEIPSSVTPSTPSSVTPSTPSLVTPSTPSSLTQSTSMSSAAPSSSAEIIFDTESIDIETSSIPSPSASDSITSQLGSATEQDEITPIISSLMKQKSWREIRDFLKSNEFTLLHIVDIGGQPEFHEILPLILHGHALNLIFFDMSHDLDSPYKVVYRSKDSDSSPIEYDSEFTARLVIQRALHSISSLQSNAKYNKPAAILVGTHRDKCSEERVRDLEQFFQEAFAYFIDKGVLCRVSKPGEKKRYIYPVNNVSGDSSDIEGLRELITTIVHSDRFDTERMRMPTGTLLLHLTLRVKFDPDPGWCHLDECVKIAQGCGISREDLLKKGGILQYLHDRFGTILHYHLPNQEYGLKISQRVIVNTNLIMRPPVDLLVTAFGTNTSEQEEAEKIRRTGEIEHRLMERACSSSRGHQSNSNKIPTDEIVELLKSRYILYENAQSDSKEPFYFLPCLLYPDHEIEQDHSLLDFLAYPPILLIPEAGYVPLGPFPATVVKLSQSSHWKLASRPRFRNRIRFYFQLPSERKLDVELRALSTHLEFRIRHNASKLVKSHLIPECLRQLREVFDNVFEVLSSHTTDGVGLWVLLSSRYRPMPSSY